MKPSPYFRILVREVAASLPVVGQAAPVPVRINISLETNVAGPFTGNPEDVGLTVDYSRIVRHILGPLADEGPFADAAAIATALVRFIFAFDDRILAVTLTVASDTIAGFHHQIHGERA